MRLRVGVTFLVFCLTALVVLVACNEQTPGTASTSANTGSGGIAVAEGPVTDPLRIDSGYISGTLAGEPEAPVHIYRGIPYAAPPAGDLRWKPPQPVQPWSGIRECTEYGFASPQIWDNPIDPVPMEKDDNCLTLNVLTPAKKTSEKLPVFVWLHGGGLSTGHANTPLFNSVRMAEQGVVIVTVNHRLNVIGLLTHPELSAESSQGVSGNYLILDLIAALQWVQRNIAAFGGDPNNVTIAGESGGGTKVQCLMASPLAKGLFQRAVIQSGSLVRGTVATLEESYKLGEEFLTKLGVKTVAEARQLPWKDLIQAQNEMARERAIASGAWDRMKDIPEGARLGMFYPFNIVVDGYVLTDNPAKIIAEGKHNPVPLLIACNQGELTGPSVLTLPGLTKGAQTLLQGNINAGVKQNYAALFDLVPSEWKALGGVCGHGVELQYVFGALDLPTEWPVLIPIIFGPNPPAGVAGHPKITDADWQAAERTMRMWVQFMRSGDPSVEEVAAWPAWEPETDHYAYVGNSSVEVKSGYSQIEK